VYIKYLLATPPKWFTTPQGVATARLKAIALEKRFKDETGFLTSSPITLTSSFVALQRRLRVVEHSWCDSLKTTAWN